MALRRSTVAVHLWSGVQLAGVVAMVVVGQPVLAVVGFVIGGVAAFVLVAVRARRGG